MSLLVGISVLLSSAAAFQPASTIDLHVDMRDAERGVLHTREFIPARPGRLTLHFPKYIPGEHGMTDSISLMANLHFYSGGKEIAWRRGATDVFTFHTTLPRDSKGLTIKFDELRDPGENTSNIGRIHWERNLLYKAGIPASAQTIRASVTLPRGWNVSTALYRDTRVGDLVTFKPANLTRLVDSPCLAGRFHRSYDVSASDGIKCSIELYGEAPEKIDFTEEDRKGAKRLMAELLACAGTGHYRRYQYLLSFSDGAGAGLEHSESSEDGIGENALIKEGGHVGIWEVLAHEGFHSWCGKYRRPVGLCTTDFQAPFADELLWVYEGMTQFYGEVVQVRAGLMSPEFFRNLIAGIFQGQATNRGRTWSSIADSAYLPMMPRSGGRSPWSYAHRGQDYYWEMVLVWLEVDIRIRTLSRGARSLTDFCRMFFGGPNRGPETKSYDFNEVVRTLNRVAPYDWARLLRARVYSNTTRPSVAGFELAGWRYVEADEPAPGQPDSPDFAHSVGMTIDGDTVREVVPGFAADRAGIGPGWKLTELNGEKFSHEALKEAIRSRSELRFKVEHHGITEEVSLSYRGGLKFPRLVRIEGKPDLLAALLKPLAKPR